MLSAPLPVVLPTGYVVDDEFSAASRRVWASAADKVRALTTRHPDRFPLYTQGGAWAIDGEAWTHWCDGFLGGELWMLSEHAPDGPWFRQRAEHYFRLIEDRKTDADVHDLGFLFWSTYRRWYEESGDARHRDVLVQAGKTSASRFLERGRYLPSFRDPASLFIDIMMNVHLVLYAASVTGDQSLARVGYEHSLTTRRYLMRGDGSASHEGMFDLATGAFLRQSTQQGYRDDGSWARGQAWALYGFGTVYRFTGDNRFLRTAIDAADFYLNQTGDRLIPPNDWAQPDPPRKYESSAAAAAAGGFWQLAGLVQNDRLAREYADYAIRILLRLSESDFLAEPGDDWEGILRHGSYHEALNLGVDESVMFGDYWLLDAFDTIDQHRQQGGGSRSTETTQGKGTHNG
ncbi:MAG: glycoside hydrolase family 88 protein [Microbacteriaceae bacterium]